MTFKEILIHKYKLTEEEWERTISYFKPEFYKPKQFFLKERMVSDKIAVINSGLFRTFFIDDNADEITTDFFEPKTLLISGESFNEQVPSEENIVSVIPSQVLAVSYSDMKKLYTEIPAWNQVCIDTSEYKYKILADRAKELQTLSATDRYKRLCKHHPLVYRHASLGQIASYLGIDIATLSRIRKKVYK